MLVLSGRSGQLAARIGPRLQLSAGPLVIGAGLALLTLAPSGPSYVRYVLPAVVVFGLGIAITVAPLTATAMSSAPAEHAGIASAVNNDVARFGGLLAVAILPALAGITGSAYLARTPSPRDSGPRCSSRERSVPPEGCSPPSLSPTRHASIATLLYPSRACTAASMRRHWQLARIAAFWRSSLGDELADLEQVEAERFDLGQDAVEPGLVQHAGQDGLWTPLLPCHRRKRGQQRSAEVAVNPDHVRGGCRAHAPIVQRDQVSRHRRDLVTRLGGDRLARWGYEFRIQAWCSGQISESRGRRLRG